MVQVKETKTKIFININGELFVASKNLEDKNITSVNFKTLNQQQQDSVTSPAGWQEIGDYKTAEDAYAAYTAIMLEKRAEGKEKAEAQKNAMAETQQKNWDALKDLPVIPATIDNLRTVMVHLNEQNWGAWSLPRLSIAYSAHQHDCDGVTATTIKLDKPVNGETMFKIGGKPGYLINYLNINMF